jgi:hypothetical protein
MICLCPPSQGCRSSSADAASVACTTPVVRVELLFNGVTDRMETMKQEILYAIGQ